MTCKLSLTRMSTTEDVYASTNTDVHNRGHASWLLHGCPQQMTCTLALTRMSTTDDVQAGSDSDMYPEDDAQAGNTAIAIKYKNMFHTCISFFPFLPNTEHNTNLDSAIDI
ncbi:hypothetical protein DPMN_062655 [Dreissena polymorpha]|uniref:Uncharacterized protein n=1 Tax=Dreissena polymorpha TaxID=45954 RepID=A0A9D4C9U3_DREPO|nr:hypothetical protein DPMN_062655 [Dreissena polymorpha]